jgi:DMSO/TMAO reductase YedYZ molybdopterin-dependent catalytic subunit
MKVTRGFKGRGHPGSDQANRVPPGQHLTEEFPVLTAGVTPHTRLDQWTLALEQDGRQLAKWNWAELEGLPQTEITTDIHCVTKWSKLDTHWRGVTFDDLLRAAGLAESPTPFVMARCDGGYNTNLPVADLIDRKGMVATHYDGAPLTPAHGGPARILVPHLYFWKSAKWVRRLEFIDANRPGFWESNGYHIHGDPWREQRYSGDE